MADVADVAGSWRRLLLWFQPERRQRAEWQRYVERTNRIRAMRDRLAVERLNQEKRAR